MFTKEIHIKKKIKMMLAPQCPPQDKQHSPCSGKKPKISVARQTEVTKRLTLMCALDLRPVSIVSGRGFKNFCSKIKHNYHVPCRTTVAKHLEFIYEECKRDLIEMLADCSVSLTTDMWTSVGARSYLTFTGYFINNKWQL